MTGSTGVKPTNVDSTSPAPRTGRNVPVFLVTFAVTYIALMTVMTVITMIRQSARYLPSLEAFALTALAIAVVVFLVYISVRARTAVRITAAVLALLVAIPIGLAVMGKTAPSRGYTIECVMFAGDPADYEDIEYPPGDYDTPTPANYYTGGLIPTTLTLTIEDSVCLNAIEDDADGYPWLRPIE